MLKIETSTGRVEYVKAQEAIFEKGIPVKERLIGEITSLLKIIN